MQYERDLSEPLFLAPVGGQTNPNRQRQPPRHQSQDVKPKPHSAHDSPASSGQPEPTAPPALPEISAQE